MFTFRKREETQYIYVVLKELPVGFTKDSLFIAARRAGELDTGYHIILHNTGEMEFDRNKEAVAQYDFPDCDKSLYVLAESLKGGKLTDAQRKRLPEIQKMYPEAVLKEVKIE